MEHQKELKDKFDRTVDFLEYIADYGIYSLFGLWLFAISLYLSPITALIFAPLGLLLWTFLEYWFHRIVLHQWPFFKELHNKHHLDTKAYIAIHPAFSLVIFLVTTLIFFDTLPPVIAGSTLSGLCFGYLLYSYAHDAIHRRWFRVPLFVTLNHTFHHHVFEKRAFGVSSPLWDIVFGTAR